ncbi:hypothetical protein OQA88_759 [Cercophora sp. LCS_1]
MGLLRLSNEMIDGVAGHLVPSMANDLAAFDPDADIAVCRIALLSLAKASRRLHAIAVRHLYHTVCIEDLRRLFTFLEALILQPKLAERVRVLSVFASLVEGLDPYTDMKSSEIFAALTPDMHAHKLLTRCFPSADFEFDEAADLTWENCDDYPESACALLLCLTDKLEALYLHLPAWNAGEYDALAAFFEDSWQRVRGESDPSYMYTLLPHLSTLVLTADPRASDSLLPDDMPQALMGNRSIKHLEVYGASLLVNAEFPVFPERWSSLETICLPCAYLSGGWWYRMCKEARPPLKRVELSLAPRYDEGERGDPDEPGCNEAFLLCADTLEHLRIGPGLAYGLPCLRSMIQLRYLETSVTSIFPTFDAMRVVDICDHLPTSLQSIYLDDDLSEPWPAVEPLTTEEEYAQLLKVALFQLVCRSAEKLPRLKSVCLRACSSSWRDYHEEASEMRGLCRVSSRIGGSIRMDFVTLQGAGKELGTQGEE